MKFDDEICKGISCPECSFNKGEDGCLLAKRLDEIEIIPEPCEDAVSRQAAIDAFLTELTKRERKNLLHTWSTVEVKYFVVDMLEKLPSAQPEIVRCHKCIHWNRDTIRQNSNDAGWWNEAICERHSDENWTSWKDADWSCADAERRTDE